MRPKSRSRVVSALPGRCFRGTRRPAAAGDGRPTADRCRARGNRDSARVREVRTRCGDLGRLFNRRVLRFRESTGTNRLSDMQFESIRLLLNVNFTLFGRLLLLSKRRQKGQNLTIDRVWVKKEVKRGQNLTLDRVWVKKEVKMGQKSYQKEVLPNMGQNGRSKRVKDLRELLMLRGNT